MTLLRAYRDVVRNGPLARLLVGEFISSIGDWLYLVAILILVYQVTEDPFVLGVVGAARVLPYLFLSIPAGIVADRFDRRLVLLSTDVARGLLMLVIAAIVFLGGPLWLVIALAIGGTCFAAFFGPAIGAYLPSLAADEEQLGPANSAWSTLDNLAFMIGPAVAGILIATGGLVVAFVLNAASFGVIAVILWGLPKSRPAGGDEPATPEEPAPDEAAERPVAAGLPAPEGVAPPPALGPAVLVPLVGLTVIDAVASFAGGGLSVLTVIIATTALGGGEEATGFLNAGIGLGGFVGAVIAGALVLRPSLVPVLAGGAVVAAIGLVGVGYAPVLGIAVAAIAVASAGSIVVEITETTVFQRAVPDAIRGRALGVMGTLTTITFAGGSFVLPVASGIVGVEPVLLATGVTVAVAGVIGALLAAPAARRTSGSTADVRVTRLAGLPLFAGVPASVLEAVAAKLQPVAVTAGEVVIRQGDPADRFYVIEDGRFDVARVPAPGAAPEHLRTMGPGEVFGEIGLLRGVPRTATVTAADEGRLLALAGADFLELVNAGPLVRPRLIDLRRGAPGSGY